MRARAHTHERHVLRLHTEITSSDKRVFRDGCTSSRRLPAQNARYGPWPVFIYVLPFSDRFSTPRARTTPLLPPIPYEYGAYSRRSLPRAARSQLKRTNDGRTVAGTKTVRAQSLGEYQSVCVCVGGEGDSVYSAPCIWSTARKFR